MLVHAGGERGFLGDVRAGGEVDREGGEYGFNPFEYAYFANPYERLYDEEGGIARTRRILTCSLLMTGTRTW